MKRKRFDENAKLKKLVAEQALDCTSSEMRE